MKREFITSVILLIILVGASFYWYELRPAKIRKGCDEVASQFLYGDNFAGKEIEFIAANSLYNSCVRGKGLSE